MTDHEHERRVGLGRVVEDHLNPDAPAGTPEEAPADERPAPDPERDVADASAQSFPASDPPTFMSDPPTPREPRTGPDDVVPDGDAPGVA